MRVNLPSRRYLLLLTLFWIIALGLAPWVIFVLRPVAATSRNVFFAYIIIDPALLLFVPMSYLLLGASEKIYRTRGYVKMSGRFLLFGGLFGLCVLPFAMGILWVWGGTVSGSYLTVVVAVVICLAAALFAFRMARRTVAVLIEENVLIDKGIKPSD